MANRKPFQLQKLMVVYNAVQVMISFALVLPAINYCYVFGTYSLTCEPVDRSRSPIAMKIARSVYWYYLAKLTELLDTVFFVLRKKDNQVSFLHIVHHGGMPIFAWYVTKYIPGGQIMLTGALNSVVHVIMYTYYMIAAMGPKYQKYLWWKKYITTIQLIQFVMAAIHFSLIFVFDCGFPRYVGLVALPNAFFMFDMFSDFYKAAYKQKMKNKLDVNGNQLTKELNQETEKMKVH
ncbi:very long chain fatty acid elongase 7-like [Culicoides brevitarsis]|uniref:very long chain fatty acid elongase 7-like n=1 Tax=Culicoides brevitarsis TaxID=469753 RepID=UPI00307C8603